MFARTRDTPVDLEAYDLNGKMEFLRHFAQGATATGTQELIGFGPLQQCLVKIRLTTRIERHKAAGSLHLIATRLSPKS